MDKFNPTKIPYSSVKQSIQDAQLSPDKKFMCVHREQLLKLSEENSSAYRNVKPFVTLNQFNKLYEDFTSTYSMKYKNGYITSFLSTEYSFHNLSKKTLVGESQRLRVIYITEENMKKWG